MHGFLTCAAHAALLGVGMLAACTDVGPPAPSPARATASPAAVTSPGATAAQARHGALGVGEPRAPQPFTREQRLLDAVSRGDRATISRALELGATLGAKDDLGRSTVVLATLDAGDLELVRWLHDNGAALDEPDAGGRTALSFAAERGRLPIVRYLVENGAAVDRRDQQQRTPLFHAALSDEPDVVGFLLERRADPNGRDQFGDTPLIVACAKGHAATAALLLKRGADPALRDQEGRTARERSAPGTAPCLSLPG
jgi:ankyrin repeat protein